LNRRLLANGLVLSVGSFLLPALAFEFPLDLSWSKPGGWLGMSGISGRRTKEEDSARWIRPNQLFQFVHLRKLVRR
jgi:hypothetical protein